MEQHYKRFGLNKKYDTIIRVQGDAVAYSRIWYGYNASIQRNDERVDIVVPGHLDFHCDTSGNFSLTLEMPLEDFVDILGVIPYRLLKIIEKEIKSRYSDADIVGLFEFANCSGPYIEEWLDSPEGIKHIDDHIKYLNTPEGIAKHNQRVYHLFPELRN